MNNLKFGKELDILTLGHNVPYSEILGVNFVNVYDIYVNMHNALKSKGATSEPLFETWDIGDYNIKSIEIDNDIRKYTLLIISNRKNNEIINIMVSPNITLANITIQYIIDDLTMLLFKICEKIVDKIDDKEMMRAYNDYIRIMDNYKINKIKYSEKTAQLLKCGAFRNKRILYINNPHSYHIMDIVYISEDDNGNICDIEAYNFSLVPIDNYKISIYDLLVTLLNSNGKE